MRWKSPWRKFKGTRVRVEGKRVRRRQGERGGRWRRRGEWARVGGHCAPRLVPPEKRSPAPVHPRRDAPGNSAHVHAGRGSNHAATVSFWNYTETFSFQKLTLFYLFYVRNLTDEINFSTHEFCYERSNKNFSSQSSDHSKDVVLQIEVKPVKYV